MLPRTSTHIYDEEEQAQGWCIIMIDDEHGHQCEIKGSLCKRPQGIVVAFCDSYQDYMMFPQIGPQIRVLPEAGAGCCLTSGYAQECPRRM